MSTAAAPVGDAALAWSHACGSNASACSGITTGAGAGTCTAALRFGRTLAVQTASGRIVGLGHLLWDGDETEVALLVEDDWQRRGIGSELLGRLVTMAVEAGCESVYAVTQAANTGMVAAMRGLSLPLDYQIEEGTLVITARLDATPVTSRLPYDVPQEQRGERIVRD